MSLKAALLTLHALDVHVLGKVPVRSRDILLRLVLRAGAEVLSLRPGLATRVRKLGSQPPVRRDVTGAMPAWLAAEINDLRSSVDPDLPDPADVPPNPWHLWLPGRHGPGTAYRAMASAWPMHPRHVVLWSEGPFPPPSGGDTLVVALGPKATRGREDVLDVSKPLRGLHPEEKAAALVRILLQVPPLSVRIGDDPLGRLLASRHGLALDSVTTVYGYDGAAPASSKA